MTHWWSIIRICWYLRNFISFHSLQEFLNLIWSIDSLIHLLHPFLFKEISVTFYQLARLFLQEKEIWQSEKWRAKNFSKIQSNQLEECLVDIRAATNDVVKISTLPPPTPNQRRFFEGCKKIVVETLLKLLEHLPINGMVMVNASSLRPDNMTKFLQNHRKDSRKWLMTSYSL